MIELLLEKKLLSDFEMDFSLDFLSNDDNLEEYLLPLGQGAELKHKESLESYQSSAKGYQYISPTMDFNIGNIKTICNTFSSLINDGIITISDICGFKQHITYDNITDEEVIWIMSKLSLNEKIQSLVKSLNTEDNITFNLSHLEDIKNGVKEMNMNKIIDACNDTNMTLVLIDGDIVWKGLASFIFNNGYEKMVEFYKKLHSFVNWISETLDENEIDGMDRENFIEHIRASLKTKQLNGFKSGKLKNGLLPKDKLDEFVNLIINNPKELLKFSNTPIPLEQIIQVLYNRDRLGKRIKQLNDMYDENTMKTINNISYKYIPYRMIVQYEDSISESSIFNTSFMTLKRFVNTKKMDGNNISDYNKVSVLLTNNYYQKLNPELFTEVLFDDETGLSTYILNSINTCIATEQLQVYEYIRNVFLSFDDDEVENDKNWAKRLTTNSVPNMRYLKKVVELFKTKYPFIINNFLFREMFNSPEEVIPYINFTDKTIYYTLHRFYLKYGKTYVMEKIIPLLIKHNKTTQDEIYNIINYSEFNYKNREVATDVEYDIDDDNIFKSQQ
jgi:hypothetical protein